MRKRKRVDAMFTMFLITSVHCVNTYVIDKPLLLPVLIGSEGEYTRLSTQHITGDDATIPHLMDRRHISTGG